MPSGKPRRHRTNPGGRPSNKERLDELQGQINNLRQLVLHKKLKDETWQMIHRIITLVNELDDLATPLKSVTWDGTGHPAEVPILPGTHLSDDEKDRRLYHAGTYAQDLNVAFHRQIRWAISDIENRLKGKESDPKPRMPSRSSAPETSNSVNDQNPQSVAT